MARCTNSNKAQQCNHFASSKDIQGIVLLVIRYKLNSKAGNASFLSGNGLHTLDDNFGAYARLNGQDVCSQHTNASITIISVRCMNNG